MKNFGMQDFIAIMEHAHKHMDRKVLTHYYAYGYGITCRDNDINIILPCQIYNTFDE